MDLRPMIGADLDRLRDLDGTIESSTYLHVQRLDNGLGGFTIEERSLRTKLVDSNAWVDDRLADVKNVLQGIEDGIAMVAEHEDALAALIVTRLNPDRRVLHVIDVRVDFDLRRNGVASALIFNVVHSARELGMRAVAARTLSNNAPAAAFLTKVGFELAGLDVYRRTNHDLVSEAVTLFWYLRLED